jgi:nucleolin
VDPEVIAARMHQGESEEKVVPPPKKVESSSEEESDEEETPKPIAKAVKRAPAKVVAKKAPIESTSRKQQRGGII